MCDICGTKRGKMRRDGIIRCVNCNRVKQEQKPLEEYCPRCGNVVNNVLWGHTNCSSCGLHFECC